MPRYWLSPTPAQEAALAEHCAHARFVWNLAVEQHAHWKPGRKSAPGFAEQCRQLTEARAAFGWLAAGSIIVQQQALKDFAQAMANFFGGTHRKPTWRRRGRNEGFRIVAVKADQVRRLSRNTGEVKIPKVGWVRFRWSRAVPGGVKSYRITRDAAGRWHVAFAAVPKPVPAPATGEAVGVDRGVAASAALSTGQLLTAPGLREPEARRLLRLERKLARARRGSHRRAKVKAAIARLKARQSDRRKDWVEKTSTDLARRFGVIAVEDLKIRNMTRSAKGTVEQPGTNVRQKAGLNRAILAAGWGRLVTRLEDKAPRPRRQDQPRVHVADLQRLRAPRPGQPREPSGVPVRRLRAPGRRRRERGLQPPGHRRGAHGGCAGRLAVGRAGEPRTSTRPPPCGVVAVGIPRLQTREDVKA
nr:RNA-guided endonuclease TnpB family protein [Planomonospora sp. ID91781]